MIANALEDGGNLEGATNVLSQEIERCPGVAKLHAFRGRLLYVREAYAEAVADFDIAIALRPASPTTLYTRARARCLLGDLDGGLEDFARCLELQPGSADALCEMALVHEYRRDYPAALEALEAALRLCESGEATSTSVSAGDVRDQLAALRERVAAETTNGAQPEGTRAADEAESD